MRVTAIVMWAPLLAAALTMPALATDADALWSGAFAPPGVTREVFAFAEFDGNLIAGDERWTGSRWEPLGDGLDGPVYALTIFDGDLIAAGEFHASGSRPLGHVARWTGSRWEALGELPKGVNALATYDGSLYAGAYRWDGANWTNVLQTDGGVNALVVYGDLLIAGGDFGSAAGVAAPALVGWDGEAAIPLGHPYALYSRALDLAVHDGQLVAVGEFASGSEPHPAVVTWDGSTWSTLLEQGDYSLCSLASVGDRLYAAGGVALGIEGPSAPVMFWWDRSGGHTLDPLGIGWINTLLPSSTGLAVGGRFSFIGWMDEVFSPNAALWDGSDFSPLVAEGNGVGDDVTGLAVDGDHLIAAGSFDAAGSTSVRNYAQWDGTSWGHFCYFWPSTNEPMFPSGLCAADGKVLASGQYLWGGAYCWLMQQCATGAPLAPSVYPGFAYHDGTFYAFHWQSAYRLDGLAWTRIGAVGSLETIECATSTPLGLVAGGTFSAISGTSAQGVALWDGSAWQPLGSGLAGEVTALAGHDGTACAGGSIAAAGGTPVQQVMRWDGAAWMPLGEPFDGAVNCLVSVGGDLYAAGAFLHAGATAASRIARWDGSAWQPLGSGVDGEILALQPFQNALYAGGRFHHAGGKPSAHLAAWSTVAAGVELQDFVANRSGAGVVVSWTMTGAAPEDGYRLLRGGTTESVVATGNWHTSGSEEYAVPDPQAPTTACDYWLEYVGGYGEVRRYGPAHLDAAAPPALTLALHANVPNPFNPRTTFAFTLPRATAVRLSIYDARGRLIARPLDAVLPAGAHSAEWDGRDRSGQEAPSGSYVARLETPQGIRARKVQLVR